MLDSASFASAAWPPSSASLTFAPSEKFHAKEHCYEIQRNSSTWVFRQLNPPKIFYVEYAVGNFETMTRTSFR